jgi:hypothetical protein
MNFSNIISIAKNGCDETIRFSSLRIWQRRLSKRQSGANIRRAKRLLPFFNESLILAKTISSPPPTRKFGTRGPIPNGQKLSKRILKWELKNQGEPSSLNFTVDTNTELRLGKGVWNFQRKIRIDGR